MKNLIIVLILVFLVGAFWAKKAFNKGPFTLSFYGLEDKQQIKSNK